MAIRVLNADLWMKLVPGHVYPFPGEPNRRIRFELNAPAPARLDLVVEDDSEAGFHVEWHLGTIQGRDSIEFTCGQPVYLLVTSEDDVFYNTSDGDSIAFQNPDAVTFTEPFVGRRVANTDQENMMALMDLNMQRLQRQIENDSEMMRLQSERLESLLAAQEAAANGQVRADDSERNDGAAGEAAAAAPQPVEAGAGQNAGGSDTPAKPAAKPAK